MKFSIIMPSLLSDYPGAAPNRTSKLIRAITSVTLQSYPDWELIVVSDGCDLTSFTVRSTFSHWSKVNLYQIERSELWSNNARNKGLEMAQGEWILYLDSDDQFGNRHLSKVLEGITKDDSWVWWNDLAWMGHQFVKREVTPGVYGECGTSTIAHRRDLNLRWKETGYGHDFHFINQLLPLKGHKIEMPEYYVCHIGPFNYPLSINPI